jgi:hypothetical protein
METILSFRIVALAVYLLCVAAWTLYTVFMYPVHILIGLAVVISIIAFARYKHYRQEGAGVPLWIIELQEQDRHTRACEEARKTELRLLEMREQKLFQMQRMHDFTKYSE